MINVRHFLVSSEKDIGFFTGNIEMTVTEGLKNYGRQRI